MRKKSLSLLWMAPLLIVLSACGKVDTISEQIGDDTEKSGACENFSEKVRSTLAQALIDGQELPTAETLQASLEKKFTSKELIAQTMRVYGVLVDETQARLQTKTKSELLEALTALEIGDRTTPEKAALVAKLDSEFAKMTPAAKAAGLDCQTPVTPTPTPSPVSTKMDPVVSGAVRVMTTAYQGCQGIDLPTMTKSTPNVQGIEITGTHEGGVGLKRMVASLSNLQKTHYYIKEGVERGDGCFDVTAHPLIYDYGGKPYATSTDASPLDFSKDAGTGTSVLGFDCSGYVFSSLAASGLRLSAGKKLKASAVYGVNAAMFMNPSSNGLSCLATWQPAPGNSLQSGDILATSGHVIILDVKSADPFGLARAKSVNDCTSAKLTSKGFDFDVLQSSPVKEGVGIDRMKAADYLDESGTMQTALVSYAVSSCLVKFGKSPNAIPSGGHIIRHKKTPECLDQPVPLAHESCVKSCYQGTAIE